MLTTLLLFALSVQKPWPVHGSTTPFHIPALFQLPTRVLIHGFMTQEFLPRQLFLGALNPSPASLCTMRADVSESVSFSGCPSPQRYKIGLAVPGLPPPTAGSEGSYFVNSAIYTCCSPSWNVIPFLIFSGSPVYPAKLY